ncbi:hypothetical protein ACS0TY_031130 [Phlomoides rotata]
MEFSRVEMADLQELSESFSNLEIVDLVNVRANETQEQASATAEPEASTSSNNPAGSDNPAGNKGPAYIYPPVPKMRHRTYDAYFGPKTSPKEKMFLEPIQPYGVALNLDVPDFRNLEELIDKWMASMKIAGTILEYDKKDFIGLIELSLTGSIKIGWEGAPPEIKEKVLSGNSRTDIVDRFGTIIRKKFSGEKRPTRKK